MSRVVPASASGTESPPRIAASRRLTSNHPGPAKPAIISIALPLRATDPNASIPVPGRGGRLSTWGVIGIGVGIGSSAGAGSIAGAGGLGSAIDCSRACSGAVRSAWLSGSTAGGGSAKPVLLHSGAASGWLAAARSIGARAIVSASAAAKPTDSCKRLVMRGWSHALRARFSRVPTSPCARPRSPERQAGEDSGVARPLHRAARFG